MVFEVLVDMYVVLGKNDQKIYVVFSERLVVVWQGNNVGLVVVVVFFFDNQLWAWLLEMECLIVVVEVEFQFDWIIVFNLMMDEIRVMGKEDIVYLELLNSSGVVVCNVVDQCMDVVGFVFGIYFFWIWIMKGLLGME